MLDLDSWTCTALTAVGQKRHVPAECTDSQWIRWQKPGILAGLSQHGIALARFIALESASQEAPETGLALSQLNIRIVGCMLAFSLLRVSRGHECLKI
ncbi:MAG TPA: hypothetical protein VN679_00200 [Candidatus Acidoferrales bacterium]|nr:hypothetical protein [Candidatus Acidoferrales bacterium]